MNDNRWLLMQSIDGADEYWRMLQTLTQPATMQYAHRCGADYQLYVGLQDPTASAHWNRFPMFRDAFANGYEKVVWLDTDTLVVDQDTNVFAATDDHVALQMYRQFESPTLFKWRDDPDWAVYNSGVIVACRSALPACAWVWGQRHVAALSHHWPEWYDQNWLNDWVYDRPGDIVDLDLRFNWVPWKGNDVVPVIRAWHGYEREVRMKEMCRMLEDVYG